MAIGERIRFFRNLRGMTQKYLGQVVGFPEKTADIRMAQYESGSRSPKAELTETLAGALGVSPLALSVPDIDSYLGLMHTLFTLEDRYGLTVEDRDGEVVLRFDPRKGKDAATISSSSATPSTTEDSSGSSCFKSSVVTAAASANFSLEIA